MNTPIVKTGKRVLLVAEDDLSLRNVLRDVLTGEGYTILEAGDGQSGLAMAIREHPDLILLDILLPHMDGLSVMKELRKDEAWGKRVPIILLTNLSPDNDKINNAIAESEPAYYLVKSTISTDEIVEKIKERLSVKTDENPPSTV